MRRALILWLVAVGLAFGGFARAEDAGPVGGDQPKRPRDRVGKGAEGRQDGLKGGGLQQVPPGEADVPAVKEEFERFRSALAALFREGKTLAQQVRQEMVDLRKAGGEKPPIDGILKKHSAQAEEIAAKKADLLATHHANLAKIYQEKQGDLIKKMSEEVLKRLAERGGPDGQGPPNGQGQRGGPGRRFRGDGPAGGGPGANPAPKAAPENF